jgi:hypothetical protein
MHPMRPVKKIQLIQEPEIRNVKYHKPVTKYGLLDLTVVPFYNP